MMRKTIERAVRRSQTVDIIYIDKSSQVTKRRVKMLKLDKQSVITYCFIRRSIRRFKIDNILAITPVADNYLIAH